MHMYIHLFLSLFQCMTKAIIFPIYVILAHIDSRCRSNLRRHGRHNPHNVFLPNALSLYSSFNDVTRALRGIDLKVQPPEFYLLYAFITQNRARRSRSDR